MTCARWPTATRHAFDGFRYLAGRDLPRLARRFFGRHSKHYNVVPAETSVKSHNISQVFVSK
jgi:hypothetical protein